MEPSSQEEKSMTRINNTGVSGPQQIPSQDSGTQQVSKTQTQKTQQEPSSAEQQQGKQAAQDRKSDLDLQGSIKQSQLAQFHGPGGGGLVGGPIGGGASSGRKISDVIHQAAKDAAIGSTGENPRSEKHLQEELLMLEKQLADQVNTIDPISGKVILELEAEREKDDLQKIKELLDSRFTKSEDEF
jgi:hypothetical protein